MTTTLNPLPSLFATLLTEQGRQPEKIGIHPAEGYPGTSLHEVTDTRVDIKTGHTSIYTNSKSGPRIDIEKEVDDKHPLKSLVLFMEREMTLFQIGIMQHERTHLLGLSPLLPAFFEETASWDVRLKKILSFFLPFGSQIQGDLVLTAKCLSAAFDLPVQVDIICSETAIIEGPAADECIIDGDCKVGGLIRKSEPCVKISIGPVPVKLLADYVPGAYLRRFLEKGLLPQLLPEGWDWQTEILVEPEHAVFQIATLDAPLFTDINTIIA